MKRSSRKGAAPLLVPLLVMGLGVVLSWFGWTEPLSGHMKAVVVAEYRQLGYVHVPEAHALKKFAIVREAVPAVEPDVARKYGDVERRTAVGMVTKEVESLDVVATTEGEYGLGWKATRVGETVSKYAGPAAILGGGILANQAGRDDNSDRSISVTQNNTYNYPPAAAEPAAEPAADPAGDGGGGGE